MVRFSNNNVKKRANMELSIKLQMIEQFKLLTSLSTFQKEDLARNGKVITMKRAAHVYKAGAPLDYVYFVVQGAVKLGTHTSAGKTLIKNIVYQNEIFGENVFTTADSRKEFVEVMKEVKLLAIPIGVFKRLVMNNHQFGQVVMQIVIGRLSNLETRMQNFVFKKAKKRIVEFITKTASLRGVKIGIDEILVNHGMSHKEIAYLTDTSRQTVARVLGELKKDNLIHFSSRKPSKILIRDIAGLA